MGQRGEPSAPGRGAQLASPGQAPKTAAAAPPLFSKRARQIQADSGVVAPAPYLPPALREGASLEQQEGTAGPLFAPSGTTGNAKGRVRAGTLPSSWSSGEGTQRFASPLAARLDSLRSSGIADPPVSPSTAASAPEPAPLLGRPQSHSISGGAYGSAVPAASAGNRLAALRDSDAGAASRLRSGSLASALPALGKNAFGPSMFSSTWNQAAASMDQQGFGGGQRGSGVAFLDDGMSHITSTARPSLAESLDGSEDVQTLDYLGLAGGGHGSSAAERTPAPTFASRHRASTLAAVPHNGAGRNAAVDSVSTLLANAGTGGVSDEEIYDAYAREHGIDPQAFAAAAVAAGFAPSSSATLGQPARLRAGTVAALGGPGGRQRTEQELLRLAMAGHFLGGGATGGALGSHASQGMTASHSSSGFGGGYSAPLEGFPHVNVSTPPPELSSFSHNVHSTPTQSHRGAAAPSTPGAESRTPQIPGRSLWIGNLDASTTGQELMHVFAPYGAIESLRLLPEKECGFVNFVEAADAIRARDDILHRLGGRIGKGTGPNGSVRIGYGKTDSAPVAPGTASGYNTPGTRGGPTGGIGSPRTEPVTFESGPGTPGAEIGPTRALWVGSIPSSTTPSTLLSIFQPFGPIESARVLTNKNCGFVNFERVDDAVMARKMLNGRDVLGSENGVMRIGFAKVPTRNLDHYPGDPSNAGFAAAVEALAELKGASSVPMTAEQQVLSGGIENYRSNLVADLLAQQQRQAQSSGATPSAVPGAPAMHMRTASSLGTSSSNSIVPSSDKGGVPLPSDMVPRPAVSDLQLLMRELSDGDDDVEADVASVASLRPPATYYTTIPLVSEVSTSRRFDTSRLRELRKTIENGQCTQDAVDAIASDHMDAIVDLASDYIGNTVVQKLFERCSDRVKHIMLERIAPHLAMIGIHKNGTWAAQKIIDTAPAPEQIAIIAQNLRPYVPPLLLDQFGNYVVQCCLPWTGDKSDFIFDAMVDRCWEIAQGRFGARSMRACLENQYVSKRQRKRVAIAIILNSVPLATSPNGALLLTWLLDTSGLSGRYRLLAPRFSPYLGNLCTHKLASLTVLRIVCQKSEPGASRAILSALFDSPNDAVLEEVLTDQVHGSQFVTKVLASNCFDAEARARYVEQVKRIVLAHSLIGVPAYRKLVEDLGLPAGPAPGQMGGAGVAPRTDLGLPPHLGPFMPTGAAASHQPRFPGPPGPGSQQQDISAMLAQMQLQQAGMFSPSSALAQPGYVSGGTPGAERKMPFNTAAPGRTPTNETGPSSSSSFPAHMRSPQSDAFNPWSNAASDWDRSASTGLSPGQVGTPSSHLPSRYGTSPNGQHSSPAHTAQSQPYGQIGRHPFLEQLGRGPFSMQ